MSIIPRSLFKRWLPRRFEPNTKIKGFNIQPGDAEKVRAALLANQDVIIDIIKRSQQRGMRLR
jgi:hypothetical protein